MKNETLFWMVVGILFIVGMAFYINPTATFEIRAFPAFFLFNWDRQKESMSDMTPRCPNYLRQEGDMIMLYDLSQPGSDTNPAVFYNMAEYAQFVKEQQQNGLHCPVLELQTDIVGASISDINPQPLKVPDNIGADVGTDDGKEYAAYNGDGSDKVFLFSPTEAPVDPDAISDNPMDTNWGGIQYSAQTLASGLYDGNHVGKPLYYNMAQGKTQMIPGMPGFDNPPPNYVPPDLLGLRID